MIQVQNLTKKYVENVVLNDISFEVGKGEILGFLGPNGAGKTTTMRILTNFLAPNNGLVKISEHNVLDEPQKARRLIGYLPENNPLYGEMKVFEYLQYIAQVRDIKKNDVREKIKKMVEVCGLQSVINKKIDELSKGYRQRVGLAQAMIHDPEILILDEPTSGLDPNQIVEIRELIRKLGENKTVILSTHILPEVQATCDRVVIIDKGKIVGAGTPEELQAQAQGKEVIHTVIKGPKDDIMRELKNIAEVSEVKERGKHADDKHTYQVEITKGHDLREIIFDLAVANNWKILEMRLEQVSLEDVFRELTK